MPRYQLTIDTTLPTPTVALAINGTSVEKPSDQDLKAIASAESGWRRALAGISPPPANSAAKAATPPPRRPEPLRAGGLTVHFDAETGTAEVYIDGQLAPSVASVYLGSQACVGKAGHFAYVRQKGDADARPVEGTLKTSEATSDAGLDKQPEGGKGKGTLPRPTTYPSRPRDASARAGAVLQERALSQLERDMVSCFPQGFRKSQANDSTTHI